MKWLRRRPGLSPRRLYETCPAGAWLDFLLDDALGVMSFQESLANYHRVAHRYERCFFSRVPAFNCAPEEHPEQERAQLEWARLLREEFPRAVVAEAILDSETKS